jgi:large subunit ribosomal protein L4e
MKIAFLSALSSTANINELKSKYSNLADEKVEHNLPLIVSELKFNKTKELISSLKKILGEKLFDVGMQKKKIRSGKGKLRGRKYKKSAGLLIVIGKEENLDLSGFDVRTADKLSIIDLANGGAGRLTIYTEKAIKELEERIQNEK